ncbi:MAG: hypothetical protein LUH14_10410 [Clostridiaceae bacterium]|nr:hypothetical protein [Clostridiaceae bacterium]
MLQEFVEQVEKVARSVMEEMHTAIPGSITSFNQGTGLATVKPYGTYTTGAGKKMAYPVITGVPVIIPQCPSANVQIAFPIVTGMDCLVIVSEQELDAWLGGGESENDMRFDLTSAIAIPGLSGKSSTALKEACNTGSVVINNGTTKLLVSANGIEVTGNLNVKGNISCTGSYPG